MPHEPLPRAAFLPSFPRFFGCRFWFASCRRCPPCGLLLVDLRAVVLHRVAVDSAPWNDRLLHHVFNCTRNPLYLQYFDGYPRVETMRGCVLLNAGLSFGHLAREVLGRGGVGKVTPTRCLTGCASLGGFSGHNYFAWEITRLRDLVLTVAMSLLAHRRHRASTFAPCFHVYSPRVLRCTLLPAKLVCCYWGLKTRLRTRLDELRPESARACIDVRLRIWNARCYMLSYAYYGMAKLVRARPSASGLESRRCGECFVVHSYLVVCAPPGSWS